MLAFNSALKDLPVFDMRTGEQVASLDKPIIDPNHLEIIAFYCRGRFIDKNSVLHRDDIVEYDPEGVLIESSDNIMPFTTDLVRLQEIASHNFSLVNKMVLDDHKNKLGKVENYTYDTDSFRIIQLRVHQSIRKNLADDSLLINRSQIIELTDKYIVVKAPDIPATGLGLRSLFRQNIPKTYDVHSSLGDEN